MNDSNPVNRARSLTEACELLNGHIRGTADGASGAELADAATFLRSRIAAWEPSIAPRFSAYDDAMRALCVAAVALYDAKCSLSSPVTTSPLTHPEASRTDDVVALSLAGFRVWSFPRYAVTRIATEGGYQSIVSAAGYDTDHTIARWYTDGSLVVANCVRLPVEEVQS